MKSDIVNLACHFVFKYNYGISARDAFSGFGYSDEVIDRIARINAFMYAKQLSWLMATVVALSFFFGTIAFALGTFLSIILQRSYT